MACNSKPEQPKIVIEDKRAFSKKLADFYFMESWISRTRVAEKDSVRTMLKRDFELLHKTTIDEFHSELSQLKSDPIIFAEIMDSVGVILKNKGEIKN